MSGKGFFSRDEVQGGLGGRRAQKTLLAIEARTAYVIAQSRRALWRILTGEAPEEGEYDYFKGISQRARFQPTIRDLERHAREWAPLVPDDPKLRAAVVRLLSRRAAFSREGVPSLRAALGLDDPAVSAAYEAQFGEPISSLYAAETDADRPAEWDGVPDWLGKETVSDLETELEWMSLPGGAPLFRRGDASDRLYVVVNGRLRVAEPGDGQGEAVYAEIGRGGLVGERSVLMDSPRATSAHAIRDTELVSLTRDGFDALVVKHPRAIMQLMRQLAARLDQVTASKRRRSLPSTIAIVPAGRDVPLARFAERLVAALGAHGPTLHLTSAALDAQLGEGAAASEPGSSKNSEVAWWLNEREATHRFVVYEADAEASPWTGRCLRQADRVLVAASSAAEPGLGEIEPRIFDPEQQETAPARDLVLLHDESRALYEGTIRWVEPRAAIRHHHVCLAEPEDVARLARFLAGKAVGLALGGGGARGLAHLGVLRAIEEAGITVDYVGGTSFGAVVGGTFALGRGVEATHDMVARVARRGKAILDLTIPVTSLAAGRRLGAVFQQNYGAARIEDLRLKLFAVSSNLTRAKMMVHTSGPLWRAVRASVSLPAVFPPVLENGDLLVDGALFDNLPADVMSDMVEGGPVIACNVSPTTDLVEDYSYGDSLTAFEYLRSRFVPFSKKVRAPNLLSVVARAILLGSSSMEAEQLARADLVIECPLSKFELFDLDRFDEIVEAGYRAAAEQLEAWEAGPGR